MERSSQETLELIRKLPKGRKLVLVEQGLKCSHSITKDVPSHAKDIDFWSLLRDRSAILDSMEELGGYRICHCSAKRWLNHDIYLVRCTDGLLLIDITFGDMKVGPLTLVTESELLASLTAENRFSNHSLIADLLLRPLARGNRVVGERLNSASSVWHSMSDEDKLRSRKTTAKHLGTNAGALAELILDGAGRQEQLIRTLRARTARDILSNSESLLIAVRKIAFYCLARLTGRNKPFGRYHRGLLVALSGTDGVGKSTTISSLRAQLDSQQMRNSTIYLGRGRDNLPGIESLRNLVGKKLRKNGAATDVYKYSSLTKAVSWYYAVEYFLRTLRPYIDAKLLGKIVLCDRYIYDIRLIPGHSKAAVWFARTVCPKPDINVCLLAPAEVVRARKAERSVQVIEDQQNVFRSIVENKLGRFTSMSIATQALSPSEVCREILTQIHTFCHPDY